MNHSEVIGMLYTAEQADEIIEEYTRNGWILTPPIEIEREKRMSIYVMTQVWRLKMPNNHQLVLLALADHAHDDGSHVFPSVEYVAWKTNYSKRNVQRIMREIEDTGLLIKVKDSGYRRATEYAINIAAGTPKEQFVPVKEVPRSVRPEIHKAFDYTCQHCGGIGDIDNGPDGGPWELDRIVPGAEGGRYTSDNVTLSCGFCNKSRRDKGCQDGTLSAEDKGCHWGHDRVPSDAQRVPSDAQRVPSDANKGATGCTLTIIEPSLESSLKHLPTLDDTPVQPISPQQQLGRSTGPPTPVGLLTDSFVGLQLSQARKYQHIDSELVARHVFEWNRDMRSGKVNSVGALVARLNKADSWRVPELSHDDRTHPYYVRHFGQYDFRDAESRANRDYMPATTETEDASRMEYAA